MLTPTCRSCVHWAQELDVKNNRSSCSAIDITYENYGSSEAEMKIENDCKIKISAYFMTKESFSCSLHKKD